MRAAVVRGFSEDLSIETVVDPACPENGVVLQTAACGVCRSDYHGWVGKHPRIKNGSILGHEYCGTVVEAGSRARYKVGDRLIAPFILGCGRCQACHTGVSNTCEKQIVPGFGWPGAYAEYVVLALKPPRNQFSSTLSAWVLRGIRNIGCQIAALEVDFKLNFGPETGRSGQISRFGDDSTHLAPGACGQS